VTSARERVINPATGRSILHGASTRTRVISGDIPLPVGHELKQGLLIRCPDSVSSYSWNARLYFCDPANGGRRLETGISGIRQSSFDYTVPVNHQTSQQNCHFEM
jgi:hypothetical protein